MGGLGPEATAYFYELLVRHTLANTDQEHIDMVVSSKATTPDRSAFIMGKSDMDPFVVMEAEAKRLVTFGAQVIAIPCNTAHYFYTRLNEVITIPVLNMVELTVQKAATLGCKKLGILATSGTVYTDTYQRACAQQGLQCAVPEKDAQSALMDMIYSDIKAGKIPDMAQFNAIAQPLFEHGCQRLVLGCTELSLLKKEGLLGAGYLDSMEVLTEAAIHACGKCTKGFEWDS